MALHFQLLDKTTREAQSLSKVDDRICLEVFNCTPHEKKYGGEVFNWFDSIGFQLASGKSLNETDDDYVLAYYKNSEWWQEELPIIENVIKFLQENYTSRNWSNK
jgi:hypothetical protein